MHKRQPLTIAELDSLLVLSSLGDWESRHSGMRYTEDVLDALLPNDRESGRNYINIVDMDSFDSIPLPVRLSGRDALRSYHSRMEFQSYLNSYEKGDSEILDRMRQEITRDMRLTLETDVDVQRRFVLYTFAAGVFNEIEYGITGKALTLAYLNRAKQFATSALQHEAIGYLLNKATKEHSGNINLVSRSVA